MFNADLSFKKANSAGDLIDKNFLSGLFGPVNNIEKQFLKTTGFSGSAHEKIILHMQNGETISLILKNIYPSQDMTIWRSGNIANREALLIDHKEMAGVWNIFQSPYIAYAVEEKNSVLLMYDLSEYLFPDIRQPISIEEEDLLLQSLARLHAHYWQHDLLSQSWLTRQENYFNLLGPNAAEEEKVAGHQHPIFEPVENGWRSAFEILPGDIKSFLSNPPMEKMTAGLPKTLIHGDSKIANFAILPGHKLAAFDWTVVASACPTCEMGWYIAVNASRLARTKEEVLNYYREFLQKELHREIDNTRWEQMMDIAILTGAINLLWNKALNLEKNIPGAQKEWDWWIDNIRVCKEKYS